MYITGKKRQLVLKSTDRIMLKKNYAYNCMDLSIGQAVDRDINYDAKYPLTS